MLILILFWLSQTWPAILKIWEYVFLVALCRLIVGRLNLDIASPSTGKNTGVVLMPYLHMEVHPTTIFGGVDISKVPGCHLLRQMSSQWRSQKLLQGLVSRELTVYFSIFNLFWLNELLPYYRKDLNQMALNHVTV